MKYLQITGALASLGLAFYTATYHILWSPLQGTGISIRIISPFTDKMFYYLLIAGMTLLFLTSAVALLKNIKPLENKVTLCTGVTGLSFTVIALFYAMWLPLFL